MLFAYYYRIICLIVPTYLQIESHRPYWIWETESQHTLPNAARLLSAAGKKTIRSTGTRGQDTPRQPLLSFIVLCPTMANAVSSFHLLRLPEKVLTKTLQCMTAIDRHEVESLFIESEHSSCILITCYFRDDNKIKFTIWPVNIPRHFVGLPMKVRVDERNNGLVDFVEYSSRDDDEESEQYAGSDFDDDEDDFDDWDDDDDNENDNDVYDSEDERESETSDSDGDSEDTSESSSSSESEDDSEDFSDGEEKVRPAHWYLRADDVRTVINHCLEIYHKSQLSFVSFLREADMFDIDYLRQTLSGFNTVGLSILMDRTEDPQFAHQVVRLDIPAKKVNASAFIFENTESLHKVLIQNYDSILLQEPLIRNQRLKVDDLLMTNASHIEIENDSISDKELNRFIKHWIRGSNSRLKYMLLSRRDLVGFNKETVLKGITHQEFEEGVVREANVTCFSGFRAVQIPSGFNFNRHDHTKATIRMKNRLERAALELVVWD
ncbi:hypothetical protein CRE_01194 [Caenorhabditis remanei]|uniref:Sdz-33 F-box domain-containing protein n=1 Tax=Caenorhabditis remanei TaxID=31234 RepID=E3MWH7_CAERE|nr:hypothetical protein CRE_01194 [Caenorhabditis remanei]